MGGRGGIEGEPVPLDSRDPRYSDYLKQLRRQIQDKWAYPREAAERELQGQLIVEIGIAKDGRLAYLDLRRSSGVRVLDLTRILAGPTHARTLAEHGADVLHIASPWLPNPDAFVMDTNHGKLSAYLDLDRADDAARLRDLVSQCDVFAQGYRAGALGRRGFGPDELAALRPGLIYVSISCYGQPGPWEARPGWEQLAQTVDSLQQNIEAKKRPAAIAVAVVLTLGVVVLVWRKRR